MDTDVDDQLLNQILEDLVSEPSAFSLSPEANNSLVPVFESTIAAEDFEQLLNLDDGSSTEGLASSPECASLRDLLEDLNSLDSPAVTDRVTEVPQQESSSPQPSKCCAVCGRATGKKETSYYGAMACHSCRVFFRRTIHSGKVDKLRCKFIGKCAMNTKAWGNCQSCRFEKCLEAGMKVSYVHSARNGRDQAASVVQFKKAMSPRAMTIEDKISWEEKFMLKGVWQVQLEEITEICLEYYKKKPSSLMQYMSYFLRSDPIPSETVIDAENTILGIIPQFWSKLGDMQAFSEHDQQTLLQSNYILTIMVLQCCLPLSKTQWLSFLLMANDRLQRCSSLKYSEMQQIESDVQQVQVDFDLNQPKYRTVHMHYPLLKDSSERQLGQDTVDEICEMMTTNNYGPDLDVIIATLASFILLFSSSGLRLDNPGLVDSMQSKYMYMLQRYLRSAYSRKDSIRKMQAAAYVSLKAKALADLRFKVLEQCAMTLSEANSINTMQT